MKNITYRGFSSFIKALRKHVLAGTYANFWTEVHSKKHALVHSKFTLAGEPQTIVYMNQLVDRMIEKMADITEQEMLDVINQVLRISFLFEDKYFFMISTIEKKEELIKPLEDGVDKTPVAQQDTIEALEATDVLPEEDNDVQDDSDSSNSFIVEIDQDQIQSVVSRTEQLLKLTVKELREILKARKATYAPAAKEAKLIELILSSD